MDDFSMTPKEYGAYLDQWQRDNNCPILNTIGLIQRYARRWNAHHYQTPLEAEAPVVERLKPSDIVACKGCGAAIYFLGRHPYDIDVAGSPTATSHFLTCPEAGQFIPKTKKGRKAA